MKCSVDKFVKLNKNVIKMVDSFTVVLTCSTIL